jgi:hypothetical protein
MLNPQHLQHSRCPNRRLVSPHNVPFPKVTADEYLCQTAADMLTLIQDKTAHPIPSLTYGSNITNAYIQIAQVLKRATAHPEPAPLSHLHQNRGCLSPHHLHQNRGCSHQHQPFQSLRSPYHDSVSFAILIQWQEGRK